MFSPLFFIKRLVLISVVILATAMQAVEPFRHVVTSANRTNDGTVLDHPTVNGQPDLRIFVTQRFGSYNPHEIGVLYDTERGRWLIQNDDASALEPGHEFHVVAFPPGPPQVFSHVTTAENTLEYYTFIRHPGSDFNANAHLLVTPHNRDGKRSAGPLGVWYDGKQWSIYRQDKQPMEVGLRFNVLISSELNLPAIDPNALGLTRVYLHTATPTNTRGYLTITDMRDPAVFPFITHNYRDAGPYNFHVAGIWHNATEWVILNQDVGDLEKGSTFNVFVFAAAPEGSSARNVPAPLPAAAPTPAAPVPALGWIELVNAESQPASFRLSYVLDGQALIFNTGVLAPEEGRRYEVPTRATKLVVRAQLEGDTLQILHESSFVSVPNREIDTRYTAPASAAP